MKKKLTDQQIIGEAGVALIARQVADMGHVWHQRQVDAGIDGEIELRDARTGVVSNRIVLVQSKASEAAFPGETKDGFHYTVDVRDLEYWLGGNAPVILVCSHPSQQDAWWAHLNEWFSDSVRRESRRVYFDKASQRLDAAAAEAVARLGAPAGSGIYLGNPPRSERLVSNLLEVKQLPATVYRATSRFSRPAELGPILRESGIARTNWVLKKGRVHAFCPFEEPQWDDLLSSSVEELDYANWIADEQDYENLFKDLLRSHVRNSIHRQVSWQARKKLLVFKPTQDLGPRTVRTGRSRARTVFKAYPSKGDPSRIAYYRHDALNLHFVHDELTDTWYAQLDPTYVFTSDGYRESPYAAEHLKGMRKLERNAAVSYSVKMWATFLQEETRIGDGGASMVFGSLLEFKVDQGIDDRNWDLMAKRTDDESGADRDV